MHNIFKEKLKDSYGESRFIIAVNVDVRNFSTFSKSVDSAESALFIKKIFQNILTNYFDDASFFKSTGDGLIIIYDIVEDELTKISNKVIKTSLLLNKQFGNLCLNEAMVNFSVPEKCGIGVSRGPATCLRTSDSVLDYFGDTLNVASRLMECAKPSGVIFDSRFGFNLLDNKVKENFQSFNIYLRGYSMKNPIQIWATKSDTKIIPSLLSSPDNSITITKEEMKFRDIKNIGGNYQITLSNRPSNTQEITVEISHKLIKNNKILNTHQWVFDFSDFFYSEKQGRYIVTLDFDKLIAKLTENKVRLNMMVKMLVAHPK